MNLRNNPTVNAASADTRRLRAHEYVQTTILEGRKAAIAILVEAVKLYAIFNAGGLIALLGFIGAAAGKPTPVITNVLLALFPMVFFGAGVISSGVSMMLYYYARLFYTEEFSSVTVLDQEPYLEWTNDADRLARRGFFCQRLSAAFAIASLGIFLIGILACVPLIKAIKF
jgi:hypothetical protein